MAEVRRRHPDVVISVDTWRHEVGEAVCEAGADVLDDAWGGLGPIDVVGHSLGAWLALEMAIRSAAPFRSITLISAAGIHLPGVARGDLFMRAPDVVLRSMVSSTYSAKLVKLTAAGDQEALNWEPVSAIAFSPMHNPHLAKWLHRVACPVQIIWVNRNGVAAVDDARNSSV